jgi:hypothetical protein
VAVDIVLQAVTIDHEHEKDCADQQHYQTCLRQQGAFAVRAFLRIRIGGAPSLRRPDAPHGVAHPAEADLPLTGWHS